MVAAVLLSAQLPAPSWEARGTIHAAVITGAMEVAGFVLQAGDHIRYQIGIAVDAFFAVRIACAASPASLPAISGANLVSGSR